MNIKGIPIVEASKLASGIKDITVKEVYIDDNICYCEFTDGVYIYKFSYRPSLKSICFNSTSGGVLIIRNIFKITEILDKFSFATLATKF